MNSVPKAMPESPATIVHHSDKPIAGPTNPSASVKGWKFPTNQKGPCWETFPWRSLSGT